MATTNLGRIHGAGHFYSSATSSTSVAKSTLTPSTIAPHSGDTVLFSNGDLRKITTISGQTLSLSSLLANYRGPQGLPGSDGSDGAIGPEGPEGPRGYTGAAGQDGAIGPEGPQGPRGYTGAAGQDGAIGPEGPRGLPGTNATTTSTATHSANGLMSSVDKTKLDGISVSNATIQFKQGNTIKGSFTLNQSAGEVIELDAGGQSSVDVPSFVDFYEHTVVLRSLYNENEPQENTDLTIMNYGALGDYHQSHESDEQELVSLNITFRFYTEDGMPHEWSDYSSWEDIFGEAYTFSAEDEDSYPSVWMPANGIFSILTPDYYPISFSDQSCQVCGVAWDEFNSQMVVIVINSKNESIGMNEDFYNVPKHRFYNLPDHSSPPENFSFTEAIKSVRLSLY